MSDLTLLPEPDPEEVLRVRAKLAKKLALIPGRQGSAPALSA
jgi:hypothetical protein